MISIFKMFRILDEDNTVSLSNVLLMVLITKIALAPTIDFAAVSGLTVTLLNYAHKKHLRVKTQDKQQDNNAELAKLRTDIDEIGKQVALSRLEG